jgi:hypothetical protein
VPVLNAAALEPEAGGHGERSQREPRAQVRRKGTAGNARGVGAKAARDAGPQHELLDSSWVAKGELHGRERTAGHPDDGCALDA